LALQLLAKRWTELTTPNPGSRGPIDESLDTRLREVERRLADATLVLPPRPAGPEQLAEVQEAETRAARLAEESEVVAPQWLIAGGLAITAVALLSLAARLLAG
jgi:hypothetical protein